VQHVGEIAPLGIKGGPSGNGHSWDNLTYGTNPLHVHQALGRLPLGRSPEVRCHTNVILNWIGAEFECGSGT
jgi:hypothetical protein